MMPSVRASRETPNVAVEIGLERPKLAPFLKWAGGKRWLCLSYPEILNVPFKRYVEPFLGSGAVYFHLRPDVAHLSDANAELITCYKVIRDNPTEIYKALARHQSLHCRDHYYRERAEVCSDPVEAAARFIYLNRTCWNGLYRVNLRGIFNVPIGTKSKVIDRDDEFLRLSEQLKSAEIENQDFETAIDNTVEGDLLFVDPPYTVKHDNNGFVKYNETIFTWSDQIRLRDAILRARDRGVKIRLTNANHQSVRDLYENIGSTRVLIRNSVISGKATFRGKAEEVLVSC